MIVLLIILCFYIHSSYAASAALDASERDIASPTHHTLTHEESDQKPLIGVYFHSDLAQEERSEFERSIMNNQSCYIMHIQAVEASSVMHNKVR